MATASFSTQAGAGRKFDLHIARLDSDLRMNVKAGENSGRKLQHDFVVLSLVKEQMTSGSKETRLPPATAETSNSREALAAWITESGQLEPIQAVGGWLR